MHELKINKLKRRTFLPPPLLDGLDPKLAHLARDAQMEQFLIEVGWSDLDVFGVT